MYTYRFELTPSKPGSDIDYTAADIKESISESAKGVNSGIVYRRDDKSIEIEKIEKQRIVLKLTCRTSLLHSARSLSAVTRYLTTYYQEVFKDEIYNKTLFRMRLLSQESSFGRHGSDISDAELLKGVVDLLYTYTTSTKKEADSREETIRQMKELVKPYLQ